MHPLNASLRPVARCLSAPALTIPVIIRLTPLQVITAVAGILIITAIRPVITAIIHDTMAIMVIATMVTATRTEIFIATTTMIVVVAIMTIIAAGIMMVEEIIAETIDVMIGVVMKATAPAEIVVRRCRAIIETRRIKEMAPTKKLVTGTGGELISGTMQASLEIRQAGDSEISTQRGGRRLLALAARNCSCETYYRYQRYFSGCICAGY